MNKISLVNIARQFQILGNIQHIESYGQGHIHDTYLIQTDQANYVMQKINTSVFKDVDRLMSNINKITIHLKSKDIPTLTIIKTLDEALYYNEFRVYDYIYGESLQETSDLKLLKTLGTEFGIFVNAFNDFREGLEDTISDFHNSIVRLKDFKETLESCDWIQYQKHVYFVLDRQDLLVKISEALENKVIPMRINHNDTKLNNLIVNDHYTVIDLDTVMNGSVLFDYGEAIRTSATTALEDCKDLSKVKLDMAAFTAFSQGFISQIRLSDQEIELLAYAPLIMTLENGMRFLKDHIEGDQYFKTKYRGHNLDRARNQFHLVKEMTSKLEEIKSIIKGIVEVTSC